jgi:thymidylate synthase (FAD)
MKIIKPTVIIETKFNGIKILKLIELAGRTAYKSESFIKNESYIQFIKKIIKSGHESVLEHQSISVRVICDRGVSHEIVRHRIASYTQESTRYCNYSDENFGNEITFIKPCFWNFKSKEYKLWKETISNIEKKYMELIKMGVHQQEARSILPNSLKTEIFITMNLREWRHFFKLRTSIRAHPQMREVANMILKLFREKIPIIFDNL